MYHGLIFYTAVTKGHNLNAIISLVLDLHLTASSQELKWFFFLNRNNKDADWNNANSTWLSRLPGRKIPQQNPSPETPKHWKSSMKIYHTHSIMTNSIINNLLKIKLHSSLNKNQIFTFPIKHIFSNKEQGKTTEKSIIYCFFINTDPR